MKILYVNHTSEVSGAERSLLDLLTALPATTRPRVAAPPGRLLTAVAGLGIDTTPIVGTAGSLRLHPVHTSRAAAEIGLAAIQVRRAAHRHGVDLIHANSIRAGIVVGLARAADNRARPRLPAAGSHHQRDDANDRVDRDDRGCELSIHGSSDGGGRARRAS
jgi:hypothetical protein